MHRMILLLAILVAVAPSALQAQVPAPGTRVRVSVPNVRGGIVGIVHQVDSAGIAIVPQQGPMRDTTFIPYEHLRRVEVSRGNVSSEQAALRGARIGALSGAAGGSIVGLLIGWARQGGPFTREFEEGLPAWKYAARSGAAAALLGTVVGAVIGSRDTEQWERVRITGNGPSSGAPSIGVSIRM